MSEVNKPNMLIDVYNHPIYLELEGHRQNAKLAKFELKSGSNSFVINYLERQNPKDVTTTYGYSGFESVGTEEWKNECLAKFRDHIAVQGNITAFIRNKLSPIKTVGSIPCAYIDLTMDIDNQINNNRKRILKKQQSQNWSTEFTKVKPTQFTKLYHETMTRLNATDEYFFDNEYFENLGSIDGVFQTIIIDNNNGKIICSGVIFEQGEYHLGATSNEYLKESPSTLMLYKSAKYIQEKNLSTKLNLGGGNENLLRFKQSFSKNLQYFESTKIILNNEVYERLVELRNINKGEIANRFPQYRD